MIISIDDTGSFEPSSSQFSYFVATHLRQADGRLQEKESQFIEWEKGLPPSSRVKTGEVKGSHLTVDELNTFVQKVIVAPPEVGITAVAVRPFQNPPDILNKHRTLVLAGITTGSISYSKMDRMRDADTFKHFSNWVRKLSYQEFLKMEVLGNCLTNALRNSIGKSIVAHFDTELVNMMYKVDGDFVRGPSENIFWHELMRCQLYHLTRIKPIVLLDSWKAKGHPFLDKYAKQGALNLNELFWRNLTFERSQDNFEIRIADLAATVISRFHNERRCGSAYGMLRDSIWEPYRKVIEITLGDFDVEDEAARSNPDPCELPISGIKESGG